MDDGIPAADDETDQSAVVEDDGVKEEEGQIDDFVEIEEIEENEENFDKKYTGWRLCPSYLGRF